MKAIFLDRDGTIIIDKVYLNDPNKVEFLPNAISGMKHLQDIGFTLFVATNQSGIPRGLVQIDNLHKIHDVISRECEKHEVYIKKYYYSPHASDSNHPTRKPNPGMLLEAQKEFSIDLKSSWMIGDRIIDVQAGLNAGTRGILLESNNSDKHIVTPEYIAKDLLDAATYIQKKL